VDPEHLLQQRVRFGHDVVAEHDHERLVPHVALRGGDRVPEPERFLLADVVDGGHVGDLADLLQLVELPLGLQEVLELHGPVEVVLDRTLPAASDDQDLGDPGPDGLLDHVLDRRLVDDRQHLLGLRLGGRQEAGAHAGRGDDGLPDVHASTPCRRTPSVPWVTEGAPVLHTTDTAGSPTWTG
jgi:hypothetical protein